MSSLVFGIPASSAISESGFSVAGNTVSKDNFRLNGKKVDQQCFVSINRTFFEEVGLKKKTKKVNNI